MKTKISTEVAHVTVTRTPLSRSKGQRSTCRGGAYCGVLSHSLLLMNWVPQAHSHRSTTLNVQSYWCFTDLSYWDHSYKSF